MYNKLFSSIINSSVWSEDSDTRVVWITLIAMQDRGGCVFGSVSGIARICNIDIQKVQFALAKFLAPDPLSSDIARAPERGGRRIEMIDGGWRLLNADHYGQIRTAEDRRLQVREAVRRHRDKVRKQKSRVTKSNPSEVEVEVSLDSDVDAKKKEKREGSPPPTDEVLRQLYQAAIRIAKCPSKEDTIRNHIIALRSRSDVGAEKLLAYLNSMDAQGMTVNDWQDHFKRRPKEYVPPGDVPF